MSKNKIRWNLPAFEQLRRSPEMRAELKRRVDAVKERASQSSDGYGSAVEEGKTRSRGAVWTQTVPAMVDNSRNQTLLRALAESHE